MTDITIPFNLPVRNYARHKSRIDDAVSKVLSGGRFVLGPEVDQFEESFSKFCEAKHCISVASGTDALLIALQSLDIKPGSEVITVANAGGYTSNACFRLGLTPVYIDINPDSLLADLEQATLALSDKTRAIVVTHLFGNIADMNAFQTFARRKGIFLIEDCCQAHGGIWNGKPVGTWGDLGVFSFYPTKNLGALGDGGAIISNDEDLARRSRELRQYGWGEKYKVEIPLGVNSRLDSIQAAILSVKLDFVSIDNERRHEISDQYRQEIKDDSVRWRVHPHGVAHLGVMTHPRSNYLQASLSQAGIGTDVHYPVLDCDQPGWQHLSWKSLALPNCRKANSTMLSLPLYPELEDREVKKICDLINQSL